MKAAKISLLEVIVGIWMIAAVVILAGVFFVPNPLAYVLGEMVGSLTSSLLMVHLYRSIDVELDLPKKKAVGHARIASVLRSIIELVVLVGSFLIPDRVLPYTVFAGLLARKIAVMLVPLWERIRLKSTNANQTDFSTDEISSNRKKLSVIKKRKGE